MQPNPRALRLQLMGFTKDQSEQALRDHDQDLQRAANALLAHATAPPPTSTQKQKQHHTQSNDTKLQNQRVLLCGTLQRKGIVTQVHSESQTISVLLDDGSSVVCEIDDVVPENILGPSEDDDVTRLKGRESTTSHCAPPQEVESNDVLSLEAMRLEESEQLLSQVTEQCGQMGDSFVDPDFPPCDKSIYLDGRAWKEDKNRALQIEGSIPTWSRPNKIVCSVHRSFDVFRGEVRPSDILQGMLGDCWFLSSLAVVAMSPNLISNLLPHQNLSRHGAYQIRLFYAGEWNTVMIDDLLPCRLIPRGFVGSGKSQLVFARAERDQLWVPLIEKAFAKLHGSYEAIEAGTCDEALTCLTGFPCDRISLGDGEEESLLWTQLVSHYEVGFLIAAACSSSGEGDGIGIATTTNVSARFGLNLDHAYSIISVRTLATGHQVLQLRDPWGRTDAKRTIDALPDMPEVRAELRNAGLEKNAGGGVFWMCWHDFHQSFSELYVCRVRHDWPLLRQFGRMVNFADQRLSEEVEATGHTFELQVIDTTQIDLTIFESVKQRTRNPTSDLLLIVITFGQGRMRMEHASKRLIRLQVSTELLLDRGRHLVFPLSFLPKSAALSFVIRIQSDRPLHCKPDFIPMPNIAPMIAMYVEHRQTGSVKCDSPFDGVSMYTKDDGVGWLILARNSSRGWLRVELDFNDSFNVASTRGALETADWIPPGHCQVLQILTMAVPGACAMSCKSKFELRPISLGRLTNSGRGIFQSFKLL